MRNVLFQGRNVLVSDGETPWYCGRNVLLPGAKRTGTCFDIIRGYPILLIKRFSLEIMSKNVKIQVCDLDLQAMGGGWGWY